MNRWISAVTLALVVWITVPLSAAEFEMVPTSELREMIKIVAPKFYREIDKISDTEFRVRVEKYAVDQDLKERGDTPKLNEWAQDILTRRQWCIDSLTTRIDQFPRDMAWEYVMNLGTNLEREEIEIGGEETFSKTIWLYRWKTGQKFAFEPDKGGVIPALLYPWTEGGDLTTKDPLKGNNRPRTKGDEARDRATGLIDPMQEAGQTLGKDAKFAAFPELEKVIRSNLNFSTTLPDEEFGDWPLWLTSFTRGDQFTDSTMAGDSLKISLTTYTLQGEFVGQATEVIGGLQELIPLTEEQRDSCAFPAYIGVRLDEGWYKVVIAVQGAGEANMGMYKDSIHVPPQTASWIKTDSATYGTGDILFPIKDGFMRGLGVEVYGFQFSNNPDPIFSRYDSLQVAMPIKVPPSTPCRVVATFIRVTENFFWPASSRPRQRLEKVIYAEPFESKSGQGIFQAKLDLSILKEPGEYVVTIRVLDPKDQDGENPFGISWRMFKLK